jgi:hypothetical protein
MIFTQSYLFTRYCFTCGKSTEHRIIAGLNGYVRLCTQCKTKHKKKFTDQISALSWYRIIWALWMVVCLGIGAAVAWWQWHS